MVLRYEPLEIKDGKGYVYELEFNDPNRTVYIGHTTRFRERMKKHESGRGTRLTRRLHREGFEFRIVAVEPGTLDDERTLQNERGLDGCCYPKGRRSLRSFWDNADPEKDYTFFRIVQDHAFAASLREWDEYRQTLVVVEAANPDED